MRGAKAEGKEGYLGGNPWSVWDGSYPLHPFLFAAASVLLLLSSNLSQATFAHVSPTMASVLAFALMAYLVSAALLRRFDVRAAVMASVWVIGALFYAGLFTELNRLLGGDYPLVRSLVVTVPLLLALSVVAARMPHALVRTAHLVLTGIALVMCASPALKAATYEWNNRAARTVYDAERAAAGFPEIASSGLPAPTSAPPPDIYHFVFDRYTSEEILARHFDLDDSATGKFLEARGFRVVRSAYANYHRTAHSLASTFYMDYLDLLNDPARVAGRNWRPLHQMLGDHRVARFLKARGYRFKQYGSWWAGTFRNPVADRNRPHGFSEFNMLYLRYTILRPLFQVLPRTSLTMRLDWDNGQCQRVAAQVEEIKSIGDRDYPLYVFSHILVPHGPYNFATDGRCLSGEESDARGERQGYIDQVVYASRIIQDLVTQLHAENRRPSIIIIQSDEGPFPDRDDSVPWHEAPVEELRIKTGILNAYFFPGGDYSQIEEGITPVNSYRALFNTYFGTDLPMLPDRVFVSPDDDRLYEFHDVTELVRGDDVRDVDRAPAKPPFPD
jgi:hypothetical protein